MSIGEPPTTVRPLAILGRVPYAAHVALRRVLRAKERDQPLIVLDYQGVAAAHLDTDNRGNLYKTPLLWCDLANRRKPTAILRMQRSAGLVASISALLARCSKCATTPLSATTIDWAAKLAWHLADRGTVGFAALLRALHRPEILQWFRRQHAGTGDIECLSNLLAYLLRFPAVWSASEGNNPIDLRRALKNNGTVWFEMAGQHFEKLEHRVVASMAEAAVLDLLLSGTTGPDATVPGITPIILYALPPEVPLSFGSAMPRAKQVGVFAFSAEHPSPQSALAWLEAAADCWVVGDVGAPQSGIGDRFFNRDELARIHALQPGELWSRSGVSGTAVSMRVRRPDFQAALADQHRKHRLKVLNATPVRQFSSALAAHVPDPVNAIDLFTLLCRPESLHRGWLRVRNHDRDSHGSDHVTIAQFGARLDKELEQLAQDLESGRYRCRTLRTVRIAKADGGERLLKIACIRDQVVQAACLGLLEPLFEPRFSHFSFAYRPNRSAHQALAFARGMIRAGKTWAVTADIRSCFDTIDHDVLLRLVGDVVGDEVLLRLLRQWLVADAFDFQGIVPSELGVPQGGALSPLLANVYLDPLDRELERTGITFARYADDYLILCDTRDEAEMALRLMADFLHAVLRLSLKPAKTQYCAIAEGVEFLDFVLDDRAIRIQQAKLDRVRDAVRKDLDILGAAKSTLFARSHALQHMNALLRGFRGYFLVDNAPEAVNQLRELDVEIDTLASGLLSLSLRHDMAWLARERLAPAESLEAGAASDPASVFGIYPVHLSAEPSAVPPDADSLTRVPKTDLAQAGTSSQPGNSASDDDFEESSGIFVDGRLYVTVAGSYVTAQGDDLVVRRRRHELQRTPLTQLAMLILQGFGVGISLDLITKLGERDVPVVFAPPFGRPAAIAAFARGGRARLRQQQILRRNDPEILGMGTAMLSAKTANQASVLKYFARYRKKQENAGVHDALSRAATEVRLLANRIRELDVSSSGLRGIAMGYEGRAAALYWSSLACLIPEQLSFPGRRAHRATDAFNQAINYVYGVLYGEVWRAIVNAGLDPYFGIMHGSERDQGSLVFDLIEEFRAPFGDRLVLGMLGRGFQARLGRHGLLRPSVRRLLVSAFHRMWSRPIRWRGKMVAPSRILDSQAQALGRAFLAEGSYHPFQFRW